mmetsp:Transcript_148293/g.261691  ORF Transcript_148293/g.261691 Transcript_148293/m.261691 type:complete len:461 (-) Transcript_148293:116-1498(-)
MCNNSSKAFVDHYALLKCSPEVPTAELKKAYHSKLREFHPDKRSRSTTDLGHRMTQALNEAWTVLQDPDSREKYDEAWRAEQFANLPIEEQADFHRVQGNELFRAGRAMSTEDDEAIRRQSVHKFQAAVEKYSAAIALTPKNHLLWSNRSTCFAMLGNFSRSQEDASRVTQLSPNFAKGWVLLVRALCELNSQDEARKQLEVALQLIHDDHDLLALQSELGPRVTLNVVSESQGEGATSEPLPSVPVRELPRSRPHSASRVSSLFSSTLGSVRCAGASLLTPPSSLGFKIFSPTSTPGNSSRSSTESPPYIERPSSASKQASSPLFSTPVNSRASTPTRCPGSPRFARPGSGKRPSVWRDASRGRVAQEPPVETALPKSHKGPGPRLETRGPYERGVQGMKQNASLGSLAASSRLGLQMSETGSRTPASRPTTAPHERPPRPATATRRASAPPGSRRAWS